MKKQQNKIVRIISLILCTVLLICMAACGADSTSSDTECVKTFKVGICNFVDDASLNQIVDNIRAKLERIGAEKNVKFEISYDNCNTDATLMNQIISNFISDKVDLMVGVATPVAMAMQAATETNKIPVVFAAVSDPEGAELVASNNEPGANITGTSDFLDTNAVMKLIFAQNPDVKKVGLLYDQGQDSSNAPIAAAKEFLKAKGIEVVEGTGTNTSEVEMAAKHLIDAKVDAIFTPTDNTVMKAELAIYEAIQKAGIPHYTGADSFALNGAFLGYGVDYANLGAETADMIAEILVDGKDTATMSVKTFDNGTATINIETCAALGLDQDTIKNTFSPFCTQIKFINFAESFDEAK